MTFTRRDFLRAAGTATAASGIPASGLLAQAPAPAKKPLVTIVNVGGDSGLCLEELIRRKGYLDEFGIDVKFTHVADSSKIIASLVGGDQDICMFSGFGQAFPAMEKGARLKILAGANSLAPVSLFSSKPAIKTLTDLEGKTVGTGAIGAALQQVCVALFQKKGIDLAKITFVNVGTTADILKAVAAGTVDAGVVNVDVYNDKDKFGVHPVADFFVDLAEYPYQGSFAATATIAAKRDLLVRTLAAHAKLYRFIQSPGTQQDYVDAYRAATGGTAEAGTSQWEFIQKYKPFVSDLVLPESRIQYIQQINVQTGVQKAVLPYQQVTDMSLARDAIKML